MHSQNRERRTIVKPSVQDKNIKTDDNSSFKSTRVINRSSSPLGYNLMNRYSEVENAITRQRAVALLKKIEGVRQIRLETEAIREKREKLATKTKLIQDALVYLVGNPACLLQFLKWCLYSQLKDLADDEIETSNVCLFYHSWNHDNRWHLSAVVFESTTWGLFVLWSRRTGPLPGKWLLPRADWWLYYLSTHGWEDMWCQWWVVIWKRRIGQH